MAKFRKLRRHYLPFLPSGDETTLLRDRLLRLIQLARTYDPALLVAHPEMRVKNILRYLAAECVLRCGELKVLQIGAFDGVADADLRAIFDNYPVRGILVEPQPRAFARLQETYRDHPNLTLINCAVDIISGSRDLNQPKNRDSDLASFDKKHLKKHGVTDKDIVVQRVDCLTVEEIIANSGLQSIDLLQIDAEGYDYEIIKSIDFQSLRPAILRFEHSSLSRRDIGEYLEMLAAHGYRFLADRRDIIAVNSNPARPTF